MVYHGKPSEACQPCRTKRRRCDLQRPSCTQCSRARITCPGYRDIWSLYFRNETDLTVRKSQEKKNQRARRPACSSDADETTWLRPPDVDSFTRSLQVNPEQAALCSFMVSFAPVGSFSYLPGLWVNLQDDEIIKAATQAAAMAFLASQSRQSKLMGMARSQYAKALTHTNKALSTPDTAVRDSTLLCVLLLSTFEALTFRGRESPKSWATHIHGAATLLNLRGEEQLKTELGKRLFYHSCMNIRASCGMRHIPIPPEFARLQECAENVIDRNSRLSRAGKVTDRITALRAHMQGMTATEVVREARDIEKGIIPILAEMKREWPWETIPAAKSLVPVCAYKGVIYQYTAQNHARLSNIMRLLRLFLNEWIYCAFHPGRRGIKLDEPLPGDPLYDEWEQFPVIATLNGEEMIDQIFGSVPYSLELLEKDARSWAAFLIWPLASIGASDICPPSARVYAIDRLKALYELHELEQALNAATMLEEHAPMEDWLHIFQFS